MALCHKYLQNFEKSISLFQQALELNYTKKDFYYEYAQALYAYNELEKASEMFQKSFEKNHQKDSSLYYQAHIAELLEQPKKAKKIYIQMIKMKKFDLEIKQLAYLKLVELIWIREKEKARKISYAQKYLIPLLNKGMALKPESDNALKLDRRREQILFSLKIHPLLMVNGRRLSKRRAHLSLTQKIKRDDNITFETNRQEEGKEAKYLDSWIYDTSLFSSYRWVFKRRWIFTPEMSAYHLKYADQTHAQVYANDSLSLYPALRIIREHRLGNKQAGFLISYEEGHSQRNVAKQRGDLQFYSRSRTLTLGERIGLFSNGEITLQGKIKDYKSYRPEFNGKTYTFSFDQFYFFKNGHAIINLFNVDLVETKDPLYATRRYFARLDYLFPSLFSLFNVSLNMGYTLLDTKLQSSTRGTEKTLEYGTQLSASLSKSIRANLSYQYTHNDSLNSFYSYEKKVLSLGLKWGLTY